MLTNGRPGWNALGAALTLAALLAMSRVPAKESLPADGAAPTQQALRSYGPATSALPPPSPAPATEVPLAEPPRPASLQGHPADASRDNYPAPIAVETLSAALDTMNPVGWTGSALSLNKLALASMDPYTDDLTLRQLREFRCSEILTRSFQRGQRLVIVKVYRYEDPLGAFGTYTTMRKGASTVVKRGDASSENDTSISFWQNNCFVSLWTTAEDDDEAKGLIKTLADDVCGVINVHAQPPAIMAQLPQLDRVVGSERLVMGPVVARQVFPVPFAGILSLDRSKIAALADYQFPAPNRERMKLLLINYPSSSLAMSVYDKYVDNLGASHKSEASGYMRLFKMPDGYLLCQLQGDKVAIIIGARKRFSPVMLARQLMF